MSEERKTRKRSVGNDYTNNNNEGTTDNENDNDDSAAISNDDVASDDIDMNNVDNCHHIVDYGFFGTDIDIDDTIDSNDEHLRKAIRDGESSDIILALMESYPISIEQIDSNGDYPLHIACRATGKNENFITTLIDLYPMAAEHQNHLGHCPLYIAMEHDISENVVLKLTENCPAAVRSFFDGFPPSFLHSACIYQQSIAVIRKLVEINPVAVHHADAEGRHPIHYVVYGEQSVEVVSYITELDPLALRIQTVTGETPLHYACLQVDIRVLEYILQQSDVLVNLRDDNGDTPIHYTCMIYHTDEIINLLLKHPDIDLNARNNNNETPLHKASYNGTDAIVEILLQLPDINVNAIDCINETPLHKVFNEIYVLTDGEERLRLIQKLLDHPYI